MRHCMSTALLCTYPRDKGQDQYQLAIRPVALAGLLGWTPTVASFYPVPCGCCPRPTAGCRRPRQGPYGCDGYKLVLLSLTETCTREPCLVTSYPYLGVLIQGAGTVYPGLYHAHVHATALVSCSCPRETHLLAECWCWGLGLCLRFLHSRL